jgi:hypothetical protein
VTAVAVSVEARLRGVLLHDSADRLRRQRYGPNMTTLFDSAEEWAGLNHGAVEPVGQRLNWACTGSSKWDSNFSAFSNLICFRSADQDRQSFFDERDIVVMNGDQFGSTEGTGSLCLQTSLRFLEDTLRYAEAKMFSVDHQ